MKNARSSTLRRLCGLAIVGLLSGAACKSDTEGAQMGHTIAQQRPADLAANMGWVRTDRRKIGGVEAQIDGMQGTHAPHLDPDALADIDWQTATAELEAGEVTLTVRWMHGGGAVRDVSVEPSGLDERAGPLRVILRPLMSTDKGAGGEDTARVELTVEGEAAALVTGAGALQREDVGR